MDYVAISCVAERFVDGVSVPCETAPTLVRHEHGPSETYRRYYAMTDAEFIRFRGLVYLLLS